MKYSINWLKELSGTKASAEKTVDDLTMRSFEIEGMEKISYSFDSVVVGEILEVRKHPNADKLRLAKVNIGKETLDIVCGAPNIGAGQKVPVALVGAKLPNGIEIRAAEIRGEKSCGMLCAEDELGLGTDHSGIMILDADAKVGMKFSDHLGGEDAILEVKVLPDRAHDALSYVGVAREICALERRKFDYDWEGLKLPKLKSRILEVEINDKALCPRYIGAVMENVLIKDSPEWLKNRLRASGIRPISNIVDATNYVMLETGQPLHAFDFEKIKSEIRNREKAKIIVRTAKKGEKIKLLDGSDKILDTEKLLITTSDKVLALAGVMGGEESGIDGDTRTIVLEAANFNAASVRRTRTRLNLKTEASDRFEKDIDPNLAEKAMMRLIEIIEHISGGELEGIVDVYPKPIKPWKVRLDLDQVDKLLGEKIPVKEAVKTLAFLGFKISGKGRRLLVEVPTFRIDVKTQEDLIEEIGRVWGYDNIKVQPIREAVEAVVVNEQLAFERKVGEILAGLGMDEVYNYSFYGKKEMDELGMGDVRHFEIENPISPDQSYVRSSLIPNILKNVRENLKHYKNFRIFEIGRTYFPDSGRVKENRMLVMAQVLEQDKNCETFLEMKGSVEDLLEELGMEDIGFSRPREVSKAANKERIAEIRINGESVGFVGEISPLVLPAFKIGKRVAMAEFDLEKLRIAKGGEKFFEALLKFPIVTRDISMLSADPDLTVESISRFIRKTGGKLVRNTELFDIFKKDGRTSYALHIELGDAERTLESKEVDEIMGKIVAGLEKELGVEVRK